MEWNSELESVVRADPDDAAAWSVLEDWTLERGDLRARVLERRKLGDEKGATEATWAWEREVFGEHYQHFMLRLTCGWRAGYLVSCTLKGGKSVDRVNLLERVRSLRSAALLFRLQADLDAPEELEPILRCAEGLPLRELRLNSFWRPTLPVMFDASVLLERHAIERIHLYGRAIALPWRPQLTRLTELAITPGDPAELSTLLQRDAALPKLTQLEIFCRTMEHRHAIDLAIFDRLFTGAPTPALLGRRIRGASDVLREALIARAASSGLLPRLKTFSFEHNDEVPHVPEQHRAAFAQLGPAR